MTSLSNMELSSEPTAPPPLLTLPLEIREQIFTELIEDQAAYIVCSGFHRGVKISFNVLQKGRRRDAMLPDHKPKSFALLAVCRQIRQDAINICAPRLELRVLDRYQNMRGLNYLRSVNIPPGWSAKVKLVCMPDNTLHLRDIGLFFPSLELLRIRAKCKYSYFRVIDPSTSFWTDMQLSRAEVIDLLKMVLTQTLAKTFSFIGKSTVRSWKIQSSIDFYDSRMVGWKEFDPNWETIGALVS